MTNFDFTINLITILLTKKYDFVVIFVEILPFHNIFVILTTTSFFGDNFNIKCELQYIAIFIPFITTLLVGAHTPIMLSCNQKESKKKYRSFSMTHCKKKKPQINVYLVIRTLVGANSILKLFFAYLNNKNFISIIHSILKIYFSIVENNYHRLFYTTSFLQLLFILLKFYFIYKKNCGQNTIRLSESLNTTNKK